jgi:peptide/nickel transport system substrate-binding protein
MARVRLCLIAVVLVIAIPLLMQDSLAQQQRPTGGTVSFGYIAKARSLDPNVWTGTSDNMVIRQIFDPLIWSPRPGFFVPGLAAAWQISKDGLTYTFILRQDVRFHDGTPLNAAAVKYMFDRIADPATRSLQRPAIGPFDRADVVNEYTVSVHLKEPFAPLLANLAGSALSPGSPTAIARLRGDYALAPVGAGPFKFEKWEGNDLFLVRNADYKWAPNFMNHQGPAYLERIVWRTIPEAATRMIALQRGDVNAVHFPALDQVADFKKNTAQYIVYRKDTPGHPKSMPINIKAAPTDDLRVRQAILYGVDRQKVVDLVQHGHAEVAWGPFTRLTPFYNPKVKQMYAHNKAKAGELLEAAGWKAGAGGARSKGGQRLRLQMIGFDSGVNKQLGEVVQAMLTELGFEVTFDVTGYDAFAKRVTDGTYNLSEINFTGLDPNVPAFLMYHSTQITGGGQFNRTRIADSKLDSYIDDGLQSTDTRRRLTAYQAFQAFAMDNALLLPLYDNSWITIAKKEVQGLTFDQEGRWLFYNAWIQR